MKSRTLADDLLGDLVVEAQKRAEAVAGPTRRNVVAKGNLCLVWLDGFAEGLKNGQAIKEIEMDYRHRVAHAVGHPGLTRKPRRPRR